MQYQINIYKYETEITELQRYYIFQQNMSHTEHAPKIRYFSLQKWTHLNLQFYNNIFHLLILKPDNGPWDRKL
jgi:hypothetical protein